MTFIRQGWAAEVAAAAAEHDETRLARLFAEGRLALGADVGSAWALALSAWDSSAVTG